MKTFRLISLLFLTGLLATSTALPETLRFTNVTVVAHEYYDYYALPEEEKWKKVESVHIEGESKSGRTQVFQSGPEEVMQVTLYNVCIPSEYLVTVTWQGGGTASHSLVTAARKETLVNIYEPY